MKKSIKEAVVRTAPVEIKVLSVGGRQMTLAVFKQIQHEKYVVLEKGGYELSKGPKKILGFVYHRFEKNDFRAANRHLVWINAGEELRRQAFYEDTFSRMEQSESGRACLWVIQDVPQIFIAI